LFTNKDFTAGIFRLKSASRKARLPWFPSAVVRLKKERKERREEKKIRKGGKV
jgi:hypothetical protein